MMGQSVILHKRVSGHKKKMFLRNFEKIANNIMFGLINLFKWANCDKLKLILIE